MADLHAVGGQGEQPFGGERLKDRLCISHLGWALAGGQFRSGAAVGSIQAVAASGGQPREDLPGRRLLAGAEVVVGTLGAVGESSFDAAGPFVIGEGENLPGPGPPGLVQGVRQQRQHPRAQDPGLAGTHVRQQDLGQVVVDAGPCRLGRLGNGHPELPLGHRCHQVAVLDRACELRVVGAAGLEIGAHPQHDQRCRYVIRAVPGAGSSVQRGDERPALPLIRALGEHLLELVDHQQQPRLWMRLMLVGGWAVSECFPAQVTGRGLPGARLARIRRG